MLASTAATAATISKDIDNQGRDIIRLDGPIAAGDDKVFNNIAIGLDSATVVLTSLGGAALVGMNIGRTIAIKGFATQVPPNGICASSCGLIWIAGRSRGVYSTSHVGFHAIFSLNGTQAEVSSIGNATVGAYLRDLGFSTDVIIYATKAAPTSMTWLSAADATSIGLNIDMLADNSAAGSTMLEHMLSPKSSLPAPVTETSQDTKPVWVTLANRDLPGFDLPGMPLKAKTSAVCVEQCKASSACSAFTYNASHEACFLKSSAMESLQFSGAYSGYKSANSVEAVGKVYLNDIQFRTNKGWEFVGAAYSIVESDSAGDCQDMCIDDAQCEAFNYRGDGTCWLLSTKPTETVRSTTAYSGARLK